MQFFDWFVAWERSLCQKSSSPTFLVWFLLYLAKRMEGASSVFCVSRNMLRGWVSLGIGDSGVPLGRSFCCVGYRWYLESLKEKRFQYNKKATLLCLIIGVGHFAFFENFHPQYHFIMTPHFKILNKKVSKSFKMAVKNSKIPLIALYCDPLILWIFKKVLTPLLIPRPL